ncbi:MAG: hypothetical protein H7Z10_04245 [Gemmatimonadaceae bacterium]|nr:hypothetical protein [Acetobacteraceae bacterium]
MTALTLPAMLSVMWATLDAGQWIVVKQQLQRTADIAALAGAIEFFVSHNEFTAATAAADLVDLNGIPSATPRTWANPTRTLTSGATVVIVGPGVRSGDNTGVNVTVKKTIPLILTKLLNGQSNVTLTASSWAELSISQPCLLALGVNGPGITAQGNPSLTLSGCSVRSNSVVSTGGSAWLTAPSIWARTTISGSGLQGVLHPNSGIVPDPYVSDSAIKNAFGRLQANQGTSFSNNPNSTNTLSPGTYRSLDVKGNLTLYPGIYYVNGPISIGSQGKLSGNGVTIVTSGSLDMRGGSTLSISAATVSNPAGGAIPGVVFAGNSTGGLSFGGTTGALVTGVVYYPKGALSFNGTSHAGMSGCLEVIAYSISLQGNSSMSDNCGAYGALTFGDKNTLGLVR